MTGETGMAGNSAGPDTVQSFLDMGGYAGYVWGAYGLVLLVLVGLLWYGLAGLKRSEATLNLLQSGKQARRRDRPASQPEAKPSSPPSTQDADHEAQA